MACCFVSIFVDLLQIDGVANQGAHNHLSWIGYKPSCGVPPFGHSTKLRIFIDPDLLQFDEVWAAAGTWNDVFPIAPNDLVGAVVTDLKRG